ncbi:hypothetical protein [Bradyrhizobium brasilense]|uniref:hypothetical protein n=1 Tax=Bradyrhizobium brasilense TaxID=1419277 RepID=UPI0015A1E629|nr:hypothetical protein [Bradyrhizobium brasilense]MCC8973598.1 hypothetical protein [Bradyrhizobium brasilense]
MSSFDCAQHTFVEARLVQRSTAVNVPQRVAFGGEAIADPAIDDNAISVVARARHRGRHRDPADFRMQPRQTFLHADRANGR